MFGQSNETKPEVKQNKWHHYLISILFVLVGLLFVIYEQMDIALVCKVFAGVFAAAGIVSVISYCIRDVGSGYYRLDLAVGVMALFAALLFITGQDAVNEYFPMIAGIILFSNGVIKLQHSIDMKRIDRKMKKVTEMWLVVMIFALAGIAAGFVTVYLTPEKMRTLFLLTGAALIVAGVSDIFTHIVFAAKVRAFKNMDEETSDESKVEEVTAQQTVAESVEETKTDAPQEEDAQEEQPQGGEDEQVLFEVEMPQFSPDNNDDTDQKA